MRTLITYTAITLSLLALAVASTHAEERFEDVEKAYLKALHLKEKPILTQHLAELERTRLSAVSKGLKSFVKEIDRDIATLEARIKKQDKALKALKDIEPLAAKPTSSRDDATTVARMIKAPLARATIQGGVHYDPSKKALVGWTSRQAEASMRVPTEKDQTYSVVMLYATSEKGRLKVAIGSEKFLPSLDDTGGLGKQTNIRMGKFTASGSTTPISISLPFHRSKPFVQIHGLRLIPQQP